MHADLLLEGLNERQHQAVTAPLNDVLILAGAGSGKTRVLTHRIAWLIQAHQQSPYEILAVTFTNKAAAEMRHRIEDIMGTPLQGMWVGTFHGLAHRLLRMHPLAAGLNEGFQILDSDDQLRLIKRVIQTLNLDEKQWVPRQAQSYINGKKDNGLTPADITVNHPVETTWLQIYTVYQEQCQRSNLIDFAELLLRAHQLWQNNPDILASYQQRFRHVLVDEFQDTNAIQYAWIKLLSTPTNHIMIVGDDDQSIYGWRGAKIENLNRFLQDFKDTQVIRLEQNYRSTGHILKAANSLIVHNPERMGKALWTEGQDGERISVYAAFNELDEANFIAGRIQAWCDQGKSLADVAILYRSNAQSRVLEEAMMHQQVPYYIYGGMRFFDRQEIKDATSYLRLILNRHDDSAFERVVNTPARGIGSRTLDQIREASRTRRVSLWQSCQELLGAAQLAGRSASSIGRFLDLINQLASSTQALSLAATVEYCIHHSGLRGMYLQERSEKAKARVENLEELVSAADAFSMPEDTEAVGELNSFLGYAALESGEAQASEHQDAVQMMTMHAAKGLEFPLVFIAGFEENMFPTLRSVDQPQKLNEERRLCYVGITRAMEKLYFTYAENRRIYGRTQLGGASRFLNEIEEQHLDHVRMRTTVTRAVSSKPAATGYQPHDSDNNSGLRLGQRVSHVKFGLGMILQSEGVGEQTRIQVKFEQNGTKWLVQAYARLTPVL
jgi:DNA helicase-2/ATP-dependent DNA helicase PcrA